MAQYIDTLRFKTPHNIENMAAGVADKDAVNKLQMETAIATATTAVWRSVGSWDASGGLLPTTGYGGGAIKAGATWRISVAGTITGIEGEAELDVNDALRALIDDASDPADFEGIDSYTPAASETVAGEVELATEAEVLAGTDTTTAVTPAGLQAKIDGLPVAVKAYSVAIGDGVEKVFVLTHNLNTRSVLVSGHETATPFELVNLPKVELTSLNTITITFDETVPTASQYTIDIIGF